MAAIAVRLSNPTLVYLLGYDFKDKTIVDLTGSHAIACQFGGFKKKLHLIYLKDAKLLSTISQAIPL